MNHCIAGHAIAISTGVGKVYAYHIELPEEEPATFKVAMVNRAWMVKEIRGKKTPKFLQMFIHLRRDGWNSKSGSAGENRSLSDISSLIQL